MPGGSQHSKPPGLMTAYQWLFFGFRGRISRQAYWLAYFFINLVLSAFVKPIIDLETMDVSIEGPAFGVLLVLPALLSNIAIGIKRLHDASLPGWIVAFMFVPFIPTMVLSVLVIGLIPGTAGPNRFGDAPDVPDTGKHP